MLLFDLLAGRLSQSLRSVAIILLTNLSEMMGYIAKGNLNIRMHRDITGEMWFGVG
jgi:hypothetical protein